MVAAGRHVESRLGGAGTVEIQVARFQFKGVTGRLVSARQNLNTFLTGHALCETACCAPRKSPHFIGGVEILSCPFLAS